MNKTEQMREWTKWIMSLRYNGKIDIIFLGGPEAGQAWWQIFPYYWQYVNRSDTAYWERHLAKRWLLLRDVI